MVIGVNNVVAVSGAVMHLHVLHGRTRIVKASVCSASHLHVDGQTLALLTAPATIQDPLAGQETAYLRRGYIPKVLSLPAEFADLHSEEIADTDIRSMGCKTAKRTGTYDLAHIETTCQPDLAYSAPLTVSRDH